MKIMIGNDDGINSIGIDALIQKVKDLGELTVIAPEKQQSARSKSLTFHKPIRINNVTSKSGYPCLAYNSSPADSIILYLHLFGRPDLVISGINAGDNSSIHSILTSGTVAVAIEAGLQNIPSFAISLDVPEEYFFSDEFPGEINKVAAISVKIINLFMKMPLEFWDQILFININFPNILHKGTKLEIVQPDTYKYKNYLVERVDPKGERYYWLWGDKRNDFDISKDCYALYETKSITISPIGYLGLLNINSELQEKINELDLSDII
ncbi:MAG: 5'/3'-nucleotidase SurE [Candidatus Heimdallarchaeota archaeon]|nr:5'/3'-nucleotidase SurE [Candidatus Heimdallarchaeota archaeon]MDH5644811.1 5'/3'-nucleotidase SurE [Candidatus Heimdallarchaeota archaeon]